VYVQVFIIMHRVKTCRATRLRQKNFRRRADRRQQSSRAARSSQTAVPSSGRAGDPNRSSAGASPARLRPRSGHSPPAPRPRAPPRADPGSSRPGSSPRRRPARLPRTAAGSFARRARPSPRRVSLSVGARAARDHVLRDLGGDPHGPGHLRAHRARLRALAHHQGDPGAPPARVRRSPPPRRARAPRAPARGFRSFSRLPRSPFPAIAPRSPPRPLSDRPSTPHHPLNPSRASSIVVLRRARNERTGDGRVPRDEAAPGAG